MRFLKSAVLVAALLFPLAGCVSDSADLIAKVQEATKKACGFVPVASSVAAVLDALAGTSGTATMVVTAAKGICLAVEQTHMQTLYGPSSPIFMGVPIEGEFEKK